MGNVAVAAAVGSVVKPDTRAALVRRRDLARPSQRVPSRLNAATHCCCVQETKERDRNPRSHKRGALSQSLPFARRETPRDAAIHAEMAPASTDAAPRGRPLTLIRWRRDGRLRVRARRGLFGRGAEEGTVREEGGCGVGSARSGRCPSYSHSYLLLPRRAAGTGLRKVVPCQKATNEGVNSRRTP